MKRLMLQLARYDLGYILSRMKTMKTIRFDDEADAAIKIITSAPITQTCTQL